MHGDIHILSRSPVATVYDFRCNACPESVSAPEIQRGFEIGLVRCGSFSVRTHPSSVRTDRSVFRVDSRSILLSNDGEEHVFEHGKQVHDECTVLRVPRAVLEGAMSAFWREESGHRSDAPLPRPVLATTPAIDYLHHRLYLAGSDRSRRQTILHDSLVTALLARLFKDLYGSDPVKQVEVPRDNQLEAVERAKAVAMERLQDDLSLADLAEAAHLSVFHFSRLFKQLTKRSPYRYLLEVRMHHAARLLRDTSASVTQISLDAGFNGLSHFTTTFSGFFGVNPTEYRRR